eukprot:COSAG01_NODE_67151_length_268_cov_0.544379_1_plen_70_part_00
MPLCVDLGGRRIIKKRLDGLWFRGVVMEGVVGWWGEGGWGGGGARRVRRLVVLGVICVLDSHKPRDAVG